MSRIYSRFAALRAEQRKALIPFITAGDPQPELTVPLMHELVRAGADLLELGVPFSDPMADGPVIQRSSERALKHGVSLKNVIDMVRLFRQDDANTPVILMGYLNPIEIMGGETFAAAAQDAGVDGVLTVDLPPEEAEPLLALLEHHALDPIFLISPTTSEERIASICQHARGFVYYVSLKGVTGSNQLDAEAVAERITTIRRYTQLPIGVGFGIKDAASAKRVAGYTDGVVVGSALVARMEALAAEPARLQSDAYNFIVELRAALDGATNSQSNIGICE